jgi:hypothetical protein
MNNKKMSIMKNRSIYYIAALSGLLFLGSCEDFLDKMPDNRTTLDTPEKIYSLLGNAYTQNSPIMIAELSSDNVDLIGPQNPYYDRFIEQIYNWEEITEKDNGDVEGVWDGYNTAILHANTALEAIAALGNPESLQAARGEALLCRVYAHFMATNIFCNTYSKSTSATDLGYPYVDQVSTELAPEYERGTVAGVYERMAADLEEALPLIDDSKYNAPKYHFNRAAAYTFASRFFLFYEQWDKVVKYATEAIGSDPSALLRDYSILGTLPRNPMDDVALKYAAPEEKANFLVQNDINSAGLQFGAYYSGTKYTGGSKLADTELLAPNPWGYTGSYRNLYQSYVWVYNGNNLDRILLPHVSAQFEMLDPVAQTGYYHSIYVAISAEEALLNRAEAYILQGEYARALADMNAYSKNTIYTNVVGSAGYPMTEATIMNYVKKYKYYTPEEATPIKRLNPEFVQLPRVEEPKDMSQQEAFLQAILYMRRYQFLHEGMRWFDIRRYGIEIYRRTFDGDKITVTDELKVGDLRRTIQIPQPVRTAGVTPNPR